MTKPYVVDAPTLVEIPVSGCDGGVFPVRRVFCVARNYAAHAREVGANPDKEPPFFFCKPADAVVPALGNKPARFPYPSKTANCHHEVELVVALKSGGCDIDPATARNIVYGYAIGLDMTRRDLQEQAKLAGCPWDAAKAFDHSAPIGPIVTAAATGLLERGRIALAVNGAERQLGDLADMIWPINHIIASLSRLFELKTGDLIFTGTPSGAGPVARGDRIHCSIDGLGTFDTDVC